MLRISGFACLVAKNRCPPFRDTLQGRNGLVGVFIGFYCSVRVFFLSCLFAVCLTCAGESARAQENYRVAVEEAPSDLTEKVPLISSLAAAKTKFPTKAAIRRAGAADVSALENALKAAGYYQGRVDFSIAPPTDDEKMIARFTVAAGPLFSIARHKIVFTDSGTGERPATFAALDVAVSDKSDGASLQENHKKFLQALLENGFPAARLVKRYVKPSPDDSTATAVYEFSSGPRALFGAAQLTHHSDGQHRTRPEFLKKLQTWESGSAFDRAKLISYRDRLAATGIFQSVDVEAGAPGAGGTAPVLVTLAERKRRSIGAGLSFSTAQGPGGRLFFEYRNLFGAGETARVEIQGTEIAQQIAFNFTKPLPRFPGKIFADSRFTNETTDAFDARTVQLSGGAAKRWLDGRLEMRGGVALETSNIRTDTDRQRTYFLSLPLTAIWNTETDPVILDTGTRATFSITPFTGSDTFTRSEFHARSRINIGPDQRFTVAGRVRLGSLIGTALDDLAINQRFFSGGGASVRGYDFQSVGPLQTDGDPVGGRSVIEGAIELRARLTPTLQLAAFADTGSVSATRFPKFDGDYLTGIGGGLRYFTPIGPIRLDLAIPLEKRATDRPVQFFISLGQPF